MVAINTNVSAAIARNAIQRNEGQMTQAMERLSTGLRINSAADDAAGLAIASKFSNQVAGLEQAARNANDGISMVQTAEGAYVEVGEMLQRMREIAVQAASETYSTTDRAALDLEFQALQNELVTIADNTQWNGFNILDGTAGTSGTVKIQSGSNASQTVDVDFGTLSRTITTGTVADTSDTVQTVTLGADVAEGDVLTFKINDSGFISAVSVTLSADDVDRLNATDAAALDGDTVFQATDAAGATVTLGGTTVDIEGTATGDGEFTVTLGGAGHADFLVSEVRVSRGGGTVEALEMNSVRTQAFSTAAITALDTAIQSVNNQRASYGSYISRLEHASDNLRSVSSNTANSRSRVQDADYAVETSELARTQIIQQAATAMLAQANQIKQTVLALLK
jgi:flagellin